MAKTIMLQGTSSNVGKSIITTALCRIFFRRGFRVAPFKAQNMALNSYVTPEGGEIGRAQAAQAEAAGIEPFVQMNPVLLKPTGNSCSQVILMGRPIGNMSAKQYHTEYSLQALNVVKDSLDYLNKNYDVVVIEGAGSPAEVNLKANDIVNMRVAKLLPTPVLLIADIDRGGALASIVGTLELLEKEERDLVQGIIINKFRGDIELLRPALEFLEQKTGKPVVGVVPYLDNIGIDDEDSVSLEYKHAQTGRELDIAVIRTPKISNFTDFDALASESDVSLRYVREGEKIGNPDLIIIPGSKNTTEDMLYLRKQGYEDEIISLVRRGTPIVGICGGYQMLGIEIRDPYHTESNLERVEGLGLINTITTFNLQKLTHQVTAQLRGNGFLGIDIEQSNMRGYEIHMGRTESSKPVRSAFTITSRSGKNTDYEDGVVSDDGLIMGTYIHGIFDNDVFRRAVLNALRKRKNLQPIQSTLNSRELKDNAYNRLADIVEQSLDMTLIENIMGV